MWTLGRALAPQLALLLLAIGANATGGSGDYTAGSQWAQVANSNVLLMKPEAPKNLVIILHDKCSGPYGECSLLPTFLLHLARTWRDLIVMWLWGNDFPRRGIPLLRWPKSGEKRKRRRHARRNKKRVHVSLLRPRQETSGIWLQVRFPL